MNAEKKLLHDYIFPLTWMLLHPETLGRGLDESFSLKEAEKLWVTDATFHAAAYRILGIVKTARREEGERCLAKIEELEGLYGKNLGCCDVSGALRALIEKE